VGEPAGPHSRTLKLATVMDEHVSNTIAPLRFFVYVTVLVSLKLATEELKDGIHLFFSQTMDDQGAGESTCLKET
jgi:hypothetical protein